MLAWRDRLRAIKKMIPKELEFQKKRNQRAFLDWFLSKLCANTRTRVFVTGLVASFYNKWKRLQEVYSNLSGRCKLFKRGAEKGQLTKVTFAHWYSRYRSKTLTTIVRAPIFRRLCLLANLIWLQNRQAAPTRRRRRLEAFFNPWRQSSRVCTSTLSYHSTKNIQFRILNASHFIYEASCVVVGSFGANSSTKNARTCFLCGFISCDYKVQNPYLLLRAMKIKFIAISQVSRSGFGSFLIDTEYWESKRLANFLLADWGWKKRPK